VSYPRLILDRHDAKPAHEFLTKVVELDLERRAAYYENTGGEVRQPL
jgi:hypothetical protein